VLAGKIKLAEATELKALFIEKDKN